MQVDMGIDKDDQIKTLKQRVADLEHQLKKGGEVTHIGGEDGNFKTLSLNSQWNFELGEKNTEIVITLPEENVCEICAVGVFQLKYEI